MVFTEKCRFFRTNLKAEMIFRTPNGVDQREMVLINEMYQKNPKFSLCVVFWNIVFMASVMTNDMISSSKTSVRWLSSKVRMPDMKLTRMESQAIAGYLLSEQNWKSQSLLPQDKLTALGRKYFQDLNCAACHKLMTFLRPHQLFLWGMQTLPEAACQRHPGLTETRRHLRNSRFH